MLERYQVKFQNFLQELMEDGQRECSGELEYLMMVYYGGILRLTSEVNEDIVAVINSIPRLKLREILISACEYVNVDGVIVSVKNVREYFAHRNTGRMDFDDTIEMESVMCFRDRIGVCLWGVHQMINQEFLDDQGVIKAYEVAKGNVLRLDEVLKKYPTLTWRGMQILQAMPPMPGSIGDGWWLRYDSGKDWKQIFR